jgi:hypothetical protein
VSELSKAFRKFVRKLLPVDYFASYQCEVKGQNVNDGTLELTPFDDRLGDGLSRVEVDVPPAYESFKVKAGAKCMVSFRNGKPDKPYVDSFRLGDGFSEVAIRADKITLNGGTQDIARKGDSVGTLTGSTLPGGGAVTFVYTSPDGTILTSPTIVLRIGQGNPTIKG